MVEFVISDKQLGISYSQHAVIVTVFSENDSLIWLI